MGTYGIGISRLLAAIVEQSHDDKGPAPFDVEIIVSNIKKEEELKLGEKLYSELKSQGADVLIDDRKERFGFKIKDYELLGIPYAIIIGKKLADGIVEIVDRKTFFRKRRS